MKFADLMLRVCAAPFTFWALSELTSIAQDLHGIREHLFSVHLDLANPHTTGRCPP